MSESCNKESVYTLVAISLQNLDRIWWKFHTRFESPADYKFGVKIVDWDPRLVELTCPLQVSSRCFITRESRLFSFGRVSNIRRWSLGDDLKSFRSQILFSTGAWMFCAVTAFCSSDVANSACLEWWDRHGLNRQGISVGLIERNVFLIFSEQWIAQLFRSWLSTTTVLLVFAS